MKTAAREALKRALVDSGVSSEDVVESLESIAADAFEEACGGVPSRVFPFSCFCFFVSSSSPFLVFPVSPM